MKRENHFRELERKFRHRPEKAAGTDVFATPNGGGGKGNHDGGVCGRGGCPFLPKGSMVRKAFGEPLGKGGGAKAANDATSPRARGERIRRLRLYLGMRAEQAARLLGVSWLVYIRYETGAPLPAEVLSKMVRVFGCSADFILGLCSRPNEHFGEKF